MLLTPEYILNNRFRILQLLGQGGYGAVYRAWDLTMDSPVAIKESLQISPEARRQFQTEARLLFKLRHPNLPRVFDHFAVSDQGLYLVMDYIEGEDLASMLNRENGRPLPAEQVLAWLGQVSDALIYLHGQNPPVIHRDIKPANIRITHQNQAMLVDFGIAKLFNPDLPTATAARAVTPGYSPLEQYGIGATDARSDVYALAATAYHLLTGVVPPEAVRLSVNAEILLPAHQRNPLLPPHIGAAIQHAMQISLTQRTPSIQAFKAELFGAGSPGSGTLVVSPTQRRAAQSASAWQGAAPAALPGAPGREQYTPTGTQVIPGGGQPPGRGPAAGSAAAPPAQPRLARRWLIGLGIGAFLLVCLGVGLALGLGLATYKPAATPTRPLAAAATLTASPTVLSSPTSISTSISTPTRPAPSQTALPTQVFSPLTESLAAPASPVQVLSPENTSRTSQLALWGAGDIYDILWLPNGGPLVVSSARGFYRYDLQSLALQSWIELDFVPYGLTLVDDGQTLVADANDGKLHRWRVADAADLGAVDLPAGASTPVISPDGQRAAAGIDDKTILLWRLSDGGEERRLEGNTDVITTMAFSQDGSLLASGGGDNTLRVWRMTDGRLLYALEGHDEAISMVAFSPDGSLLASSSYDGKTRLWRMADGGLQRVIDCENQTVYDLAFAPSGEIIAAVTNERKALLWRVSDGQLLRSLEDANYSLFAVTFSPDGSRLAALGADSAVYVWEVSSGKLLARLAHTAPYRSVQVSPDGELLAVASQDYHVYLWDWRAARLRDTLSGHDGMVSGVAFSPDGKRLVSSSYDGTARLWEVASWQELRKFVSDVSLLRGVAFAPDGESIATVTSGELRLWNTADGSVRWEQKGSERYYGVAFAPDGTNLATSEMTSGQVSIWDAASGERLAAMKDHTATAYAVAYSPDGKTLASASFDNTVRLWAVPGGGALRVLQAEATPVYSLAFSPDGRLLAGGAYRKILLWDAATGELLATLTGHTASVRVTFTPDGLYLISAGIDGTIRFWGIAP